MNILGQIGLLIFGNKEMTKNITVLLGDYNLAPYEFKISTNVLGAVNPILFGYILKSNDTQEIMPGIVKEWQFDHKNKYKLKIANTYFHNGRKVTASDLEFSIVRGFISDKENYNRILFSDIAGIENLKIGDLYKPGMVSGIKTINENTIEIVLKNKNPIFLLNLTIPFAPIVPIEELKDDYYTWKKAPIGAGPFKIKKDYSNHSLVLQKTDSNNSLPETIEFHTQRKDFNYDIIFDNAILKENEEKYNKWYSKHPSMITSLFFFKKNKFARNENFRKAIHHAIERTRCVNNSILHKPAFEMKVDANKMGPKKGDPYNIETAKKYANKLPSEFFKEEIKVAVFSNTTEISPIIKTQVQLIESSLRSFGFNIKFEPTQEKFPTEALMSKYSIKLLSKVVDLADPSITYGAMSKSSPYNNEIPDSDGKFEDAYERAIKSETYEERLINIDKISNIIDEKTLISPLFYRYTLFRTNPKTIKSLGDQPKPLFIDLSLVEMH